MGLDGFLSSTISSSIFVSLFLSSSFFVFFFLVLGDKIGMSSSSSSDGVVEITSALGSIILRPLDSSIAGSEQDSRETSNAAEVSSLAKTLFSTKEGKLG